MTRLLLLALGACALPQTSTAEIRLPDYETAAMAVPVLQRADDIGARYVIEPLQVSSTSSPDVYGEWWNRDLARTFRITFPSLSINQCEALKQSYGSFSRIRCVEGERYELQDFLAPMAQALTRAHFVVEKTPFPIFPATFQVGPGEFRILTQPEPFTRSRLTLDRATNCWASAYEFLRGSGESVAVFNTNPEYLEKFLLAEENTHPVTDLEGRFTSDAALRNATMQPGDLVFISQRNVPLAMQDLALPFVLSHVAVFVDENLYWEKANSGSASTFRFVDFDSMVAPYRGNAATEFRYVVRRPVRPALALPHPRNAFSLCAQGYVAGELCVPGAKGWDVALYEEKTSTKFIRRASFLEILDLPLAQDALGRFRLAGEGTLPR